MTEYSKEQKLSDIRYLLFWLDVVLVCLMFIFPVVVGVMENDARMKAEHATWSENGLPPEIANMNINCPICDWNGTASMLIEDHNVGIFSPHHYICPECGYNFENIVALRGRYQ